MSDPWKERGARLWLVGRPTEEPWTREDLLPANVDVEGHHQGDPWPRAGESFDEALHDGIARRRLLQRWASPLIGSLWIEHLGTNEIGFVLERAFEFGHPPSVARSIYLGLYDVVRSAIERKTRKAPWPASSMSRPMWLHVLAEWSRRQKGQTWGETKRAA